MGRFSSNTCTVKPPTTIVSVLRIAQLLGIVILLGAAVVIPLSGCAAGPREQYFDARGTVFTASAGDRSVILSPGAAPESVARVLSP